MRSTLLRFAVPTALAVVGACSLDETGTAPGGTAGSGASPGGTAGLAGAGGFVSGGGGVGGAQGGSGGESAFGGTAATGGDSGMDGPDGATDAPADTPGDTQEGSDGDATVGWSPADFPNCVLWLDASDPATLSTSGANVDSWKSKCGTNQAVAAGAQRPQLTVVGGKLAIQCDGLKGQLEVQGSGATSSQYSLFFVIRKAFAQPIQRAFWSTLHLAAPPGGSKTYAGFYTPGTALIFQDKATPAPSLNGVTALLGVASLVFEYSVSPTGAREIYLNGSLDATGTISGGAAAALGIGTLCANSTTAEHGQYDLFEVIMYDRYLAAQERTEAHSELKKKWGL